MHQFQDLCERCVHDVRHTLEHLASIPPANLPLSGLRDSLLIIERDYLLSEALLLPLKNCIISFFNEMFFSPPTPPNGSILNEQIIPFIDKYINPWLVAVDHGSLTRAWNLAYYSILFHLLDYSPAMQDIDGSLQLLRSLGPDDKETLHAKLIATHTAKLLSPNFYFSYIFSDQKNNIDILWRLLCAFHSLSSLELPFESLLGAFSLTFPVLKREKKLIKEMVQFFLQAPLNLLFNIEATRPNVDGLIPTLAKHLQNTSSLRYTLPFILIEEVCVSKILFAEEFQQAIAKELLFSASLLSDARDKKVVIDDFLNRLSALKSILLIGKQENVQPDTPSSTFVFLFSSCETMISDLYVKVYSTEQSFQFRPNCKNLSHGPTEISLYSLNAFSWQHIPRHLAGSTILKFTSIQLKSSTFKMHPLISFILRHFPNIFEQKLNPGMYLEWSMLIGTIDLQIVHKTFHEIPLLAAIVLLLANQEGLIDLSDHNELSLREINLFSVLAPRYCVGMDPTDLEEMSKAVSYWNPVYLKK